jgi:prephenate dehydrogenase
MLARSITIIGVGLIGGSLGLALKSRGLVDRIVGLGRDPSRLDEALRRGAIDAATIDPAAALAEAEIAVVCTPVSRIVEDAVSAATHGSSDLIVTDVGSTKRAIVETLDCHPALEGRFVGAHPIAGSERTGVGHADAQLFESACCVVTPGRRSQRGAVARVEALWESVGCRVRRMTPTDHDRSLALVSHLPHAVAAALVHAASDADAALAGGAYRDGTRVAASDEGLWADIFLANRTPTLEALDTLGRQLEHFRRLLDDGDREALTVWWRESRQRRSDWPSSRHATRGDAANACRFSSGAEPT